MRYILFFVLALFILIFSGCNQVEDSSWKYHKGYHIGDIIQFGENSRYELDQHGNIYVNDSLAGMITKVGNNRTSIRSQAGEKGIYVFYGK